MLADTNSSRAVSPNVGHVGSVSNTRAKALAFQIALARATDLAFEGRLAEAEDLLAGVSREWGETPAGLDLLARIRVRQKQLGEAARLWQRASELDPADDAYKAALERAEEMRRHPSLHSGYAPLVTTTIAGLLIVGLCGFLILKYAFSQRPNTVTETNGAPAPESSQEARPVTPPLDISIPGASVRDEGGELVVTFHTGLFRHGITLKPEAKEELKALGRRLESLGQDVTIKVIGHTDDVPLPARTPYRDNYSLGLSRAITVVEFLRAETRVPASAFTMKSVGESTPLYPNNDRGGRLKNQTVEVRIVRAGS